jgi:Flp pilus assembly pilin Flp
MSNFARRFILDTEGQDLIEYALLAATLVMGSLAALQGVRGAIQGEFSTITVLMNGS